MDKAQKQSFVKELNASLEQVESVVVSHYDGLTVGEMTSLRASARTQENQVLVAKNRLVKIAFVGTKFEGLADLMTGPTVLTMAPDAVSAAKVAQKFADDNENFRIIGGAMGATTLDKAGVKDLSKMPSLDEMRAQFIGLLQAPGTQLVRTMAEPASSLVRVLDAKAKQSAA